MKSFSDIQQGPEYDLISEYTTVMNILGFWIWQGYTRIWITYFMIDVWHHSEYALNSEYAKVLNMLGLHMILNNILHHIWLGSEYALYSEYATSTQGSVESGPS